MELYQIRYFLEVCETLNFARAAERSCVSAPSLTRAVQKLEGELGGLLIRREGRQSHLTELGRLLRPMLEEVIAHSEATKAAAKQFVGGADRRVRLGVAPPLAPERMVPFLMRFSSSHPEIGLDFVEDGTERLDQQLMDGALDVVLAGRYSPRNNRLRHDPLYREGVAVVFPPGHWIERRNSVRLSDLKGEEVLLRADSEILTPVLKRCREQGIELHIVQRGEPEEWVQVMVATDEGISLVPENTTVRPDILTRCLDEPDLRRDVFLTTVAGRPFDVRVGQVVRAIRGHRWSEKTTVARGSQDRAPSSTRLAHITA